MVSSHTVFQKLSKNQHPEKLSGQLLASRLQRFLPMYMELVLGKGLAGRMEFCRASSSLEGGGS